MKKVEKRPKSNLVLLVRRDAATYHKIVGCTEQEAVLRMESYLKEKTLDKHVKKVFVDLLIKPQSCSNSERFLECHSLRRHINVNYRDKIGGLIEDSVHLPRNRKKREKIYIGQLSVVMGKVSISRGAVIMGHRIVKGDGHIGSHYNTEDRLWPLG